MLGVLFHMFIKGQKKPEKVISAHVLRRGKNLSFQVRFLGELETPITHFEVN